jgi:hypothetical protein
MQTLKRVFVLGLIVCSQAAWSQVYFSESPSYDGSYTVSFPSFPLGCNTDEYGVYFCNTFQEQVGNTATGAWWAPAGSTSMNFSGKSANTYGYGVWVDWSYEGQQGTYFVGPYWVQVILPQPVPNSNHYHYTGPGNNPQSYMVVWNATNASYCDLTLDWADTYGPFYQQNYSGLATSYQVQVPKLFSFTNFVGATVTCYGPGGSGQEWRRLEFNESMSP